MAGAGPFSAIEWLIAGRYLRARRKDGFVSVIAGFSLVGIALGVATLIVVSAVFEGALNEAMRKVLGLNGHMVVSRYGAPLDDYDAVTDTVRKGEGVVNAFAYAEAQVMATANGRNSGVILRGVKPEDFRANPVMDGRIVEGSLDWMGQEGGVVVGSGLADALGLKIGEPVTLVSPTGPATGFGTAPRIKGYPVAAIYQLGLSQYDRAFVFLSLEDAQIYLRMDGQATGISATVDDPQAVDPPAAALADALAPRGLSVTTWAERDSTFFSIFAVQKRAVALALALIIFVAALNIISGLTMLVKDKGRDIAILRTMGATRGRVLRIFFIAGASIGVVGTALGLALGLLICTNIEAVDGLLAAFGLDLAGTKAFLFERLSARVRAADVGLAVAIALGLSFLATLYPAWRAARLDPVEALRYE